MPGAPQRTRRALHVRWRVSRPFSVDRPRPRESPLADPWTAGRGVAILCSSAPVAQLDRALPSGGKGQRFESSRARQLLHLPGRCRQWPRRAADPQTWALERPPATATYRFPVQARLLFFNLRHLPCAPLGADRRVNIVGNGRRQHGPVAATRPYSSWAVRGLSIIGWGLLVLAHGLVPKNATSGHEQDVGLIQAAVHASQAFESAEQTYCFMGARCRASLHGRG